MSAISHETSPSFSSSGSAEKNEEKNKELVVIISSLKMSFFWLFTGEIFPNWEAEMTDKLHFSEKNVFYVSLRKVLNLQIQVDKKATYNV